MPSEPERTETDSAAGRGGGPRPVAVDPPRSSIEMVDVDGDRYAVEGEIARGGMGRILRAVDRRLGRPVALKLHLGRSARHEALFEREIRITARLQHPAVVSIYEAGRLPDGGLFYAMKLVDGRSLREVIDEASSARERLALLPEVLAACEALAYAHRHGIIHRDLKPSNVLVGGFGETVVADWGLAKELATDADSDADSDVDLPPESTVSGKVAGTPNYMPPEQARGQPVDERADVYALGAMLYHVLHGAPPYRGERDEVLAAVRAGAPPPLARVARAVPDDLAAIVARAMARDPDARYPSAVELADELRRFTTGQLVAAHRYSRGELVRRWLARHRAEVVVAGAALLLLVILSLVGVHRIVRERDVAASRADRLTLAQARLQLDRDPAAALDALAGLSAESPDWGAARVIAADALARGVGTVVARTRTPIAGMAATAGGALITAADDGEVALRSPDGERRVLWQLGARPRQLFVAGDRWLVALGGGRAIHVADLDSGESRELSGHTNAVLVATVDAAHQRLISADVSGVVLELGLAGGPPRELGRRRAPVARLALSPDGAEIAVADRDGGLARWPTVGDRSTGDELRATGDPISGLAYSPDGRWLAAGGLGGSLVVWPRGGGEPRSLRDHGAGIVDLAITGDSAYLAAVTEDGGLRVWSIADGARRRLSIDDGVRSLAVDDDGARLISGMRDGSIALVPLDGGPARRLFGHGAAVREVRVLPARQLLSAGDDRTVRRWSLDPPGVKRLSGHASWVSRVAYAGDRLLSAGWDSTLRVWDPRTGKAVVLRGHVGPVRDLAVSADGRFAATASDDHTVRRWRIADGAGAVIAAHQGAARAVAIDADGGCVVSGGDDNAVQVWIDAGGGRALSGHRGPVVAVALTADGRRAVSGSEDGTVRVWDVRSGNSVVIAAGAPVQAVALSPDGAQVAAGDRDGEVWIAPSRGGVTRTLSRHAGPVRSLAFSSDGARLVSTSDDMTARVYDLRHGGVVVLRGHRDIVVRAAFAPGSNAVATAAEDGTVRVWDPVSGAGRVLDADGWLADVAWSADGHHLAAAGASGAIHTWVDDLPSDAAALRAWLALRPGEAAR